MGARHDSKKPLARQSSARTGQWNRFGFKESVNVSLADVIARNELLSPREAATLVLAIGREWERSRGAHDHSPIPPPERIELTATGAIVFVEAPRSQQDAAGSTLSALLGHLLGLDDRDAPRHHVPGGLLITIAGRLGALDLPSAREDGFMDALTRFADADPDIVLKVSQRVRAARKVVGFEEGRMTEPRKRRGLERRRQPPAVTALRRAVRDLERQTFETRALVARARRHQLATRRRLTQAAVAVAVFALAIAGFLVGRPLTPTTESVVRSQDVNLPAAALPRAEVTTVVSKTPINPARRPAVVRTRKVRENRPAAGQQRPTQPHVIFAGGTRSIPWAHTSR
jgi:hypothetical protein